jgi:hypothetical protein
VKGGATTATVYCRGITREGQKEMKIATKESRGKRREE